jgi:hypothetical protein
VNYAHHLLILITGIGKYVSAAGTCNGDSGGPIYVQEGKDRFVVTGYIINYYTVNKTIYVKLAAQMLALHSTRLPLTQSVLIRTVFYLCKTRSELPQLLLYFSSVFFSLKANIHGHHPMTIFLADYVPYSITADAIRTIPGVVHMAFMASAVTLQET